MTLPFVWPSEDLVPSRRQRLLLWPRSRSRSVELKEGIDIITMRWDWGIMLFCVSVLLPRTYHIPQKQVHVLGPIWVFPSNGIFFVQPTLSWERRSRSCQASYNTVQSNKVVKEEKMKISTTTFYISYSTQGLISFDGRHNPSFHLMHVVYPIQHAVSPLLQRTPERAAASPTDHRTPHA